MKLDMFEYCADELKEELAPTRKAMADRQITTTAQDTTEAKGI
jgi:hypothetical protein